MEALLQRHLQDDVDEITLIAGLVSKIRPRKSADASYAEHMIGALCHILGRRPDLRASLRGAVLKLLGAHKPVSLYVESGILPSTGFFTELYRRVSHKILPEAIDSQYLKDLFALVFTRDDDEVWVNAVPDARWLELLAALRFDELLIGHALNLIAVRAEPEGTTSHSTRLSKDDNQVAGYVEARESIHISTSSMRTDSRIQSAGSIAAETSLPSPVRGIVDAVLVLSYRISSIGLEPELIRNEPSLEEFASPFLTQNDEVGEYLEQFSLAWADASLEFQDERHILVLLDQCAQIIQKIRRTASRSGTSISLTFLLQRLTQQLERMERLLAILAALREDKSGERALPLLVGLFKTLVSGECHKNDVRQHWRESLELLALRVTENASRTGEHYITSTRSEYFALLKSAMGAGLIIAFMAVLKLQLSKEHLPPLTEALLFSLNYGLGFMLIHILHFTVATKQPAMTASAIAASIGEHGGNSRDMESLTSIIAQTLRSQLAAILGNVLVVIPMAMLIAWGVMQATGVHFISPEKAHHLMEDIDPIHSLAVFYAAIAGVCLFLSGLIAGHHDNLAMYNRIPQRLKQLRWLERLLGKARLSRVADYVENNLGALAGNFYFGCMLGGMTAIGVLFGLPVDIRHITFSSAYLGFSLIGLDFAMQPQELWLGVLGIALIGLTNLVVSFTLALSVAMKARKVTFTQRRALLQSLGRRFRQRPGEFLLPPKAKKTDDSDTH
ncbi:site-specific recombinase [Sideroxydans sp. CL21]|uniref:site-specific recombinase n=1 Tax=Sideroxydans sp. CL21 TaxID=2600596 RepID=UPI0012AA4760|nr:site-specific recombinase [Sideroxydans sp. CL21]VVC82851.1 Probable site-specific recombinase [Sideroxydans sp. CL21]